MLVIGVRACCVIVEASVRSFGKVGVISTVRHSDWILCQPLRGASENW